MQWFGILLAGLVVMCVIGASLDYHELGSIQEMITHRTMHACHYQLGWEMRPARRLVLDELRRVLHWNQKPHLCHGWAYESQVVRDLVVQLREIQETMESIEIPAQGVEEAIDVCHTLRDAAEALATCTIPTPPPPHHHCTPPQLSDVESLAEVLYACQMIATIASSFSVEIVTNISEPVYL